MAFLEKKKKPTTQNSFLRIFFFFFSFSLLQFNIIIIIDFIEANGWWLYKIKEEEKKNLSGWPAFGHSGLAGWSPSPKRTITIVYYNINPSSWEGNKKKKTKKNNLMCALCTSIYNLLDEFYTYTGDGHILSFSLFGFFFHFPHSWRRRLFVFGLGCVLLISDLRDNSPPKN